MLDCKRVQSYNLKYLGLIGSVFHTKDIEAAIEKGRKHFVQDTNSDSKITPRSLSVSTQALALHHLVYVLQS
jgi:hypothetical protein